MRNRSRKNESLEAERNRLRAQGVVHFFAPNREGGQVSDILAPLPYQRHSDTSREAALMAEPHRDTDLARVLLVIRAACVDGVTDEEIVERARMAGNTVRPRRVELVQRGLVIDSGVRRPTRSGRKAVVWRAT